MFEVSVEQTFAAGHALRNYRGKCENVHGHNYRCEVTVEGEQLDDVGLLVDFVLLKKALQSVIDRIPSCATNSRPTSSCGRDGCQSMLVIWSSGRTCFSGLRWQSRQNLMVRGWAANTCPI